MLDGSVESDRTLVLTFTRKAAWELKSRLTHLGAEGVQAGTFHAIAYAQLRRYWADTGRRLPAVVDGPDRVVRKLLGESPRARADVALTAAVSAEISWARARMLAPDDYPEAAFNEGRSGPDPSLVAETFTGYTSYKARKGLVDLDDLVEQCARLLEDDPKFSAAQRFLHRHFFVDELQDLNPAQWRLLPRMDRRWRRPVRRRGPAPSRLLLERSGPGLSRLHREARPRCDRDAPW